MGVNKNIIAFIRQETKRASLEMKNAQDIYQEEVFHTRNDIMNYAYTVGMCTATLDIMNRLTDFLIMKEKEKERDSE